MSTMMKDNRGRVTVDYKRMRIYTPGQYRPPHLRPNRNGDFLPNHDWRTLQPRQPRNGMIDLPSTPPEYEHLPAFDLPKAARRAAWKIPARKVMLDLLPSPWRPFFSALDLINTIGSLGGGPFTKTPDVPGFYDLAAHDFTPCWLPCGGEYQAFSVSGGGCAPIFQCLFLQVPAGVYGDPIWVAASSTGRNAIHFGPYSGPPAIYGTRMDYHITYSRPTYNPATGQIYPGKYIPFTPPAPGQVFPVNPEPQPKLRTGTMTRTKVDLDDDPVGDPYLNPSPGGTYGGSSGASGPATSPTSPAYHIDPRNPDRPTPGTHTHRPSRSEKKLNINVGGPLGAVYGGLTETKDALKSLADAIPDRPCRGQKTLQGLAMCVWKNRKKINPGSAAYNLLTNMLQDKAIGTIGGIGKNAVRSAANHGYYTRPVGLQTGGRFNTNLTMVNL